MLEENLKEITKMIQELNENYNNESEFYKHMAGSAKKHINELDKIRDKSSDPNFKFLADMAALTETRQMATYSSFMVSLNLTIRLSAYLELTLVNIK